MSDIEAPNNELKQLIERLIPAFMGIYRIPIKKQLLLQLQKTVEDAEFYHQVAEGKRKQRRKYRSPSRSA